MKKSTKQPVPTAGDFQSLKDYCEQSFPSRKRCPHPHCPENDKPEYPYGKCTMHEPIWISIPAGGHVHITCPIHAQGHILYGSNIHMEQPKWEDLELWKQDRNLPERETNLPDYSKIGKVCM